MSYRKKMRDCRVVFSYKLNGRMILSHPDDDHQKTFLFLGEGADLKPLVDPNGMHILLQVPHHGPRPSAPPAAAVAILEYVCPPHRLETVLGDLEQNFRRRSYGRGPAAARRWYWWQVARSAITFGIQIVTAMAFLREVLKRFGL